MTKNLLFLKSEILVLKHFARQFHQAKTSYFWELCILLHTLFWRVYYRLGDGSQFQILVSSENVKNIFRYFFLHTHKYLDFINCQVANVWFNIRKFWRVSPKGSFYLFAVKNRKIQFRVYWLRGGWQSSLRVLFQYNDGVSKYK